MFFAQLEPRIETSVVNIVWKYGELYIESSLRRKFEIGVNHIF